MVHEWANYYGLRAWYVAALSRPRAQNLISVLAMDPKRKNSPGTTDDTCTSTIVARGLSPNVHLTVQCHKNHSRWLVRL